MYRTKSVKMKLTIPRCSPFPRRLADCTKLLGGVGHCSAWHVQVSSGLIDFTLTWHKEQGCCSWKVADISTETLDFMHYFQV